jgi:hypothetical protein
MATQRSTEGPEGFLYGGGELGPRWSRVNAIGLGGRCSGAALYAECSEVVVAVGGGTVRSGRPRVQTGRDCKQARRGRSERRGGKAGVALGRALVAAHGGVTPGSRACACARWTWQRSGRSGRRRCV